MSELPPGEAFSSSPTASSPKSTAAPADPPYSELGCRLQQLCAKYGKSNLDFKTAGIQRPQRHITSYLAGRSAPGTRQRMDEILVAIGVTTDEYAEVIALWNAATIKRNRIRFFGRMESVAKQLAQPSYNELSEYHELMRLARILHEVKELDHDIAPVAFAKGLRAIERICEGLSEIVQSHQRPK